MSFSERFNYVSKQIQINQIDNVTRTMLWNVLEDHITYYVNQRRSTNAGNGKAMLFYDLLWTDFLNNKRNRLHNHTDYGSTVLRSCEIYLDTCIWFRYYDFIEFFITKSRFIGPEKIYNRVIISLRDEVNKILSDQNCSYRIIDDLITPVTNEGELLSIEKSLNDTRKIKVVHDHLIQALKLFSDRQEPDYRNSIKESISAIETLVKIIVKDEKSTLGDGLKKLRGNNVHIHDALIKSISGLYGWTSDEEGIRHGLKTGSNIDIEDAQFSLVTCCGIASYLMQKAIKAGVSLK